MKPSIIRLILPLLCLCAVPSYSQEKLLFPYNSVEILPFNPHNWYTSVNASELEKLIRHKAIKVIVELGSWMGGSTRHMASLLPKHGKVYAIDTWQGTLNELDSHSKIYDLSKLYRQFLSNVIHATLTDKIIPIKMDTLEAARIFVNLKPDLVYIDASHDEDSVYQDIQAWWPFVKDHGTMCGDDWDYHGVKKAVLKFATNNNLDVYGNASFWMFINKQ